MVVIRGIGVMIIVIDYNLHVPADNDDHDYDKYYSDDIGYGLLAGSVQNHTETTYGVKNLPEIVHSRSNARLSVELAPTHMRVQRRVYCYILSTLPFYNPAGRNQSPV